MRYWVARAKPALNEPFEDWLVPERIGRWWTKRPPRIWDTGDRLFVWASSPQQQIIALGELAGLQTAPDEEGVYRYRLRYLTGVLRHPVERATLSSDPVLSKSILIAWWKPGQNDIKRNFWLTGNDYKRAANRTPLSH